MSKQYTIKALALMGMALFSLPIFAQLDSKVLTKTQTQAEPLSASQAMSPNAPTVGEITRQTNTVSAKAIKSLNERPEVQAFISDMSKKHGFDKKALVKLFAKAHINQDVIDKMNKPYEALAWHRYQKLFTTPTHVEQGVAFWKANAADLKRAEKTFGVPAEVIVAIIGVETRYGRNTGSFKVIDALTTLAFEYPKRAPFFKSELEQFLLLTRELKRDPLELTGSYAGAMGKPQFISSSYRNFAVDFSGQGKRDILGSDVDAIGSVANYFNKHGWDSSLPVAFKAKVRGHRYERLTTDLKAPKPIYNARKLKKSGVAIKGKPYKNLPLSFIALDSQDAKTGKDAKEFWVGTQNFYVITRYNHSVHYAMAVHQLSQLLKEEYKQNTN